MNRSYGIALLAGLFLGVGTVFYEWWPLSLIAFGFVLHLLQDELSTRERVVSLSIVGLLTYGFSFFGIYFETMPLDWLGLPNSTALGVLGSIWCITIAIFTATFVVLMNWCRSLFHTPWIDALIVSSAYVIADTLGTFFYSLVFYGQSASIGAHFSMGSPGYQLADSYFLLQTSAFGGLYALLFLQAFIGCLGYVLITQLREARSRLMVLFVYGSLVAMVVYMPPAQPNIDTERQQLSVAVFGIFDTKHESEVFRETLLQNLKTVSSSTDIVALPEDSRFIQYMNEFEIELLAEAFDQLHIFDSGTLAVEEGFAPEIQFYATQQRAAATSSKEFLMVFGEYMPYLYTFIGTLIGQQAVVDSINENHRYQTSESHLFLYKNVPLSAKLCSDAMSPVMYAREASEGATVLFNLASHGWFHRSELLYELAKRVGRVRAVESQRWYVRAAYETPAFVLNEEGQVVAESRWHEDAVLEVVVPVITSKTLYSEIRFGILLLPTFFLLICFVLRYRAKIVPSR